MRSHVYRSSPPRRRIGGAIAVLAAVATFAGGGVAHAQSGSNVARGKLATSLSVPCSAQSGPGKAVDGDQFPPVFPPNIYTNKWCARPPLVGPHVLTVNLGLGEGYGYDLNAITLLHAQYGGESPLFNTRAYSIQVSPNGLAWGTVATSTANTASNNTYFFPAGLQGVTQVRLVINQAEQRPGVNVARIYELQAWGTARPIPLCDFLLNICF